MRYPVIILLVITGLPAMVSGQSRKQLVRLYKSVVVTLSADDMKGRMSGTADEVRAGAFVAETWQHMKLKPATQSFVYMVNDTGREQTGTNIYCYIDNHSDSTILISAHYDHLGMGGGAHSRSYGKTGIHPGADDNASGVALMMGLARSHKRWQSKQYNYLFVGYAAHEVGLYGSAAFSKYGNGHFKPVCMAVNFDMVGRLDAQERTVTVYGFPSLYKDGKLMQSTAFDGRIYTDEPEKVFITDCKPFAAQGIHCLSFTTGLHADYHKVSDVAAKINYEGIYTVQLLVEDVLKSYPATAFTYEQ